MTVPDLEQRQDDHPRKGRAKSGIRDAASFRPDRNPFDTLRENPFEETPMSEKHSADLTGQDWLDHLDEEHGWSGPKMKLVIRSSTTRNPVAVMHDLEPFHAEELVTEWIRAGVGGLIIEMTHEVPW